MNTDLRWMRRSCLAIAASLCAAAQAQPSVYGDFLADAKPILDTRLRFESVEQDGVAQTAEAITLRGRLGFESGKIAGTALLAEGEFIRPIVEDYNSTINGNGVYPIVPRSARLRVESPATDQYESAADERDSGAPTHRARRPPLRR